MVSRSLLVMEIVLDVGVGDEKGDPWPFNCESRVSIV